MCRKYRGIGQYSGRHVGLCNGGIRFPGDRDRGQLVSFALDVHVTLATSSDVRQDSRYYGVLASYRDRCLGHGQTEPCQNPIATGDLDAVASLGQRGKSVAGNELSPVIRDTRKLLSVGRREKCLHSGQRGEPCKQLNRADDTVER